MLKFLQIKTEISAYSLKEITSILLPVFNFKFEIINLTIYLHTELLWLNDRPGFGLPQTILIVC